MNLHHRLATIKRNYRYLGALEGEIRDELGIGAAKVFITRESEFYRRNRPAFFGFARISYGVILFAFVCLFLGVRMWSDLPNDWSTEWLQQWNNIAVRQNAYDQLLFCFDVILAGPILLALFAYVTLAFAK